MVIRNERSRKFRRCIAGCENREHFYVRGIERRHPGHCASANKDNSRVSHSKIMSLPGRFMLVASCAAVLVLMAAIMVRTMETYGLQTFAGAAQNQVAHDQATQDKVSEAHKPLPAGPRRLQ